MSTITIEPIPSEERSFDGCERIHPTARQYVVKVDGERVGDVVKSYTPGMVIARNCVGGSFPGYWRWTFDGIHECGPFFDAPRLKELRALVLHHYTKGDR